MAALALIGLLSVAFLDPSRQPTIAAPTSSPSAAAEAPTSSQVPEWLAKLVEDYRDACGPDDAEQVAADLVAMNEDDAKDHVEELIDACDGGRSGRGRGRD